jgi:hypothetical protein
MNLFEAGDQLFTSFQERNSTQVAIQDLPESLTAAIQSLERVVEGIVVPKLQSLQLSIRSIEQRMDDMQSKLELLTINSATARNVGNVAGERTNSGEQDIRDQPRAPDNVEPETVELAVAAITFPKSLKATDNRSMAEAFICYFEYQLHAKKLPSKHEDYQTWYAYHSNYRLCCEMQPSLASIQPPTSTVGPCFRNWIEANKPLIETQTALIHATLAQWWMEKSSKNPQTPQKRKPRNVEDKFQASVKRMREYFTAQKVAALNASKETEAEQAQDMEVEDAEPEI